MPSVRKNTSSPRRQSDKRESNVDSRPWSGFQKGRTPKPALTDDGYYTAILRGDLITEFDGSYGPALRIPFDVYFKTNKGVWEVQRMSILASENTSLNAKFMQVMQVINERKFNDDTDISQINKVGWCTVYCEQYDQYMNITDVERLSTSTPEGVELPTGQKSLEVSTGYEEIPF